MMIIRSVGNVTIMITKDQMDPKAQRYEILHAYTC